MAYKNRKNKVKFKLQWPLIVLVVCLVGMLVATIIMMQPSQATKKTTAYNNAIQAYNTANSTSYSYLTDENVYSDCDQNNIESIVAGDGFVYVVYGSLNQERVLANLANINTAAEENEISTVYLFTSAWVEEQEDLDATEFKLAHQAIENNLNKGTDTEKFSMLTYPALLVFENGKLVFNSQAYTDADYTDAWATYIQKAFYTYNNQEK